MRQKNNSTIVWIGAKTKYTGKQNVEVLNVQEDNINKIERKDRQFHYTLYARVHGYCQWQSFRLAKD